jgi:hypothetical protein
MRRDPRLEICHRLLVRGRPRWTKLGPYDLGLTPLPRVALLIT